MRLKRLLRLSHWLLTPVYRVYERLLWRQIRGGPMPRHIGIIPDGNRRWARLRGWDVFFGHERGYERMREVLDWIWDLGITHVTVYAMSTENCTRRSVEERNHLFDIIKRGLEELGSDPRIRRRRVRVKVIGRREMVRPDVLETARRLEEETGRAWERTLYIALCYGGRDEILEAARRIAEEARKGNLDPRDINESLFRKYLYTNGSPDPDLIIRTSGEERISNFLLWQSAYSELYFAEAYWPEFRKIDLWRAIRSYQKRERRYGA